MSVIDLSVNQRLLRYLKINTQSLGSSESRPSSQGQIELLALIREELISFGSTEMKLLTLADGSLICHFPASPGMQTAPHLAVAVHVDTHPDASGVVVPRIHENYDGGGIILSPGAIIQDGDLRHLTGQTIITSSGDSLLGGDDKAGVAAVVTLIEMIITGKVEHGELSFWFAVDEEIGKMDFKVLPETLVNSWAMLLTVDGEEVGTIDVRSADCRLITAIFQGQAAHVIDGPKIRAAHYAASKFVCELLMKLGTPWCHRDGGFVYVMSLGGSASEAKVVMAPRSLSADTTEQQSLKVMEIGGAVAAEFGLQVVFEQQPISVDIGVALAHCPELFGIVVRAHESRNVAVIRHSTFGATDGGMLNLFKPNLPAPNIGAGGGNFHSLTEYLSATQLAAVPPILMEIVSGFAAHK
jgi:tripeptide aminopeptidase